MSRAPSAAERALWGDAVEVVAPRDVAELGEIVRAAEMAGRTIVPAGSGAHAEAADPPEVAPLVVTAARFDAVIRYEPDDFTIGVGAGMELAELGEILRRRGQELPHDVVPGARGTVGGLVARAPYSPRQGSAGPLHALVLGAEGVRGGGRPFKSGGMVVKNVAGYQVHKLVVGSLGRLGILTRVNFRLRPIPARRHVAVAGFASGTEAAAFVRAIRARRLEPACFAILSGDEAAPRGVPWPDGSVRVAWMFEGSAARVTWLAGEARKVAASLAVRTEEADDPEAGAALRERLAAHEEPPGDRRTGIARLAAAPTDIGRAREALARRLAAHRGLRRALLADALAGIVVARWTLEGEGTAELDAPARDVAEAAASLGGTARLVHLPGPLRKRCRRDLTPDPNEVLAARVRAAFDPAGVFGGAAATEPAS